MITDMSKYKNEIEIDNRTLFYLSQETLGCDCPPKTRRINDK